MHVIHSCYIMNRHAAVGTDPGMHPGPQARSILVSSWGAHPPTTHYTLLSIESTSTVPYYYSSRNPTIPSIIYQYEYHTTGVPIQIHIQPPMSKPVDCEGLDTNMKIYE